MADILVIEDDQRIRELVCDHLASDGHSASSEANGLDGLRSLTTDKPDALVLDLGLPDLDGIDLLRMVRSVVENLNVGPKHRLDVSQPEEPAHDPQDLMGIIPGDNRTPYDVREVISRIVDGSRFHEFKQRYANTLVCGFARIHGYPVGIVANNGILFSESALKGAHFVELCGQRGIPLVFLQNITGFKIGRASCRE